ncbi:MAG: hypothetical protein ACOCRO_05850 [Halanaerobiales bacterium]
MKFKELNKKSYFRDRIDDLYTEDSIAYFEEIKVKDIKEDEMVYDRIHIHFKDDGTISKSVDTLVQSKEDWDSIWSRVEFVSEKEMYRRVIKYIWEK